MVVLQTHGLSAILPVGVAAPIKIVRELEIVLSEYLMNKQAVRILIMGAHPDDADIKAGGCAALWTSLGHVVKMVSMTDGSAGHHSGAGPGLAVRRRAEAQAAAAVIGATYDVWDYPDGQLAPTLEVRHRVIRAIRMFRPDLILTHRLTDYHPDHRYASQLVQDAAYLVTVPAICPDVPIVERNPVIMYFSDGFKKPYPFQPRVAVDVEPQLAKITAMLDCHVSQFYEWLPFNGGYLDQVPAEAEARKAWLGERMARRIEPLANRYRELILSIYGAEHGRPVRYIEAFELSEVGAALDRATYARLFPFLPPPTSGGKDLWHDWPDLRDED
jgi:LmbE family N-acetylglucosaminyl deacetylase